MTADVARTDHELRMLERLVDCAYALGLAVGEAAKAEADTKKSFGLYDLFHRSFLAVRMGIRLSLTLRAGVRMAWPAAEPEQPEHDPPEREDALEAEHPERGDRLEVERERDRDYEPLSLPRFLSTLGLVARDAAGADGLPAAVRTRELPALQALLADADASPVPAAASGVAVLSRPPPARPPARPALLGSTASATPLLAPRLKPPWSGSG